MIRVEGLRKRAGEVELLRGITVEVPAQTALGIIGASGSGKTTLLRCLNGLEKFDQGFIECGGVRLEGGLPESVRHARVKELRRRVGMVFQHLHLFPHINALGNITEAPIHVLKTPRARAETEAHQLLHSFGIGHAAARFPASLSGGEQQRVAIARALAMRPEALLFDEPTSALDPRRTAEMRTLLREYVTRGHTMVVVSHSIKFLDGLADHLLYMERGEVVEHGAADQILHAPAQERTREFLRHA